MRKIILLILIFLIPSIVLATTFENLKVEDSITDEGWNIEILKQYEDSSVLLQVYLNPNYTFIEKVTLHENRQFDGIYVNLTDSFYDAEPSLSLIELKTNIIWRNECDETEDCEDHDICTTDFCTGYPQNCEYKNTTWCMDNDGCCPSKCSWKMDNDCERYSCAEDFNCNDYNISTNDTCSEDNICIFTEILWCIDGDRLCPDNCTHTTKLWDNRDSDCSKDSECIGHIDCNDNNDSTIDLCLAEPSTAPKKCEYSLTIPPSQKEEIDTSQPIIGKKTISHRDVLKITKDDINNIFLAEENRVRSIILLASIFGVILIAYILYLVRKFNE
jgi:hypothetical protein